MGRGSTGDGEESIGDGKARGALGMSREGEHWGWEGEGGIGDGDGSTEDGERESGKRWVHPSLVVCQAPAQEPWEMNTLGLLVDEEGAMGEKLDKAQSEAGGPARPREVDG